MSTTLDHIKEIQVKLKKGLPFMVIISIVVTLFSYFYYRSFKTQFETYSKIFPLSINSSSGTSPMDVIKSQFGMSQKSDLDKIYNVIELVKSKNVSLKVVQQAPVSTTKFKTLAEWLFSDHNEHLPLFEKKIPLSPDTNANYFIARDLLVSQTNVTSEKTEFYTISTWAYDQNLAKELNEAILKQLSILYINMTTEKPRTDLMKIKVMRDSLNNELSAIERAIAGYRDSNQLAVKFSIGVPQKKLERTRAEIEQLYTTTATAYQNAKFKLLSESPIFQVLDKPGEPFTAITIPTKQKAITYGILAFVFSGIWFSRSVFRNLIMEELKRA